MSVEKYADGENAVYEFVTSTDDSNSDDVATVFNVPLKHVFGAKYKCASFYRDKCRIVMTLVSTGFPANDNYLTESELPYGNSHVWLQDEDNTDIVFSFSTARDHIPTLLLEEQHGGWFTINVFVALVVLLLMVVYYYITFYGEETNQKIRI